MLNTIILVILALVPCLTLGKDAPCDEGAKCANANNYNTVNNVRYCCSTEGSGISVINNKCTCHEPEECLTGRENCKNATTWSTVNNVVMCCEDPGASISASNSNVNGVQTSSCMCNGPQGSAMTPEEYDRLVASQEEEHERFLAWQRQEQERFQAWQAQMQNMNQGFNDWQTPPVGKK